MQCVEDGHRHLIAPGLHLFLIPITVEADIGAGKLLRKCEAVVPFADQDVADLAASVEVIDAAAGAATGMQQRDQNFPMLGIIGPVDPRLR